MRLSLVCSDTVMMILGLLLLTTALGHWRCQVAGRAIFRYTGMIWPSVGNDHDHLGEFRRIHEQPSTAFSFRL
jgi:hypothetical protein